MVFAISQFCSHEMPNLQWDGGVILKGCDRSKRRLQSIMKLSFTWFTIGGVFFACILIPVGLKFFETVRVTQTSSLHLKTAWIIVVVSTALNIIAIPPVAILQGCGRLHETTQMRILQSIIAGLVGWSIIVNGGGVLAIAGVNLCGLIFVTYWIKKHYWLFFRDILKLVSDEAGICWRTEIWPFQWRMAISTISGFFLFQMFTPILIKTEGPVSAGKMGMSLNIFQGLSAVAISWITSKTPDYGILIATNRRNELDKMFFRGLVQSTAILLLAVLAFITVVMLGRGRFEAYTDRVLGVEQLMWLGIATMANHVVYAEALYLRSHKQEPLMIVSFLAAAVLNCLIYLFASRFGSIGISMIYAGVTVFVSLGLGTLVFIKKRNHWSEKSEKL